MQDVAPRALNHLNILKYTGCPSINYFTEGGVDVLTNRGHCPTRHRRSIKYGTLRLSHVLSYCCDKRLTEVSLSECMELSDCPSYYPIAVTWPYPA